MAELPAEIRSRQACMGAVLEAVSTSSLPSSDAMSVMRDDMKLGAWRDSGSPLEGRWTDVVADGSWKVGEVEVVIIWFGAFRVKAGVVVTSRAPEAKRQGVMRRNVG